MRRRKPEGSVFLQAIIFFITTIILVSLTGELNNGWQIISELNSAADLGAQRIVSDKSLNTFAKQEAAINALLVSEFKHVTNASEQIAITWLNNSDVAISTADPNQQLPLFENTVVNPGDPSNPSGLLVKAKVRVSFPPSDVPADLKFPSGFLGAIIGNVNFAGTGERLFKKKADPKHFVLFVRTRENTISEYLPVCAEGSDARTKDFWDNMCRFAARMSEGASGDGYEADGIISGTTGQGAQIQADSVAIATDQASSEMSSFDRPSKRAIFAKNNNFADCDDSTAGEAVVNSVACFPSSDGSYTAPTVSDIRYIIFNDATTGIPNTGEVKVFIDPSLACPELAGANNCCSSGNC